MRFTIEQPKKNDTNPGLLLVFIDSLHFSNGSLDNFVKILEKNDFYNPSRESEANVIDLAKEKKRFFPVTVGIALKHLKKVYWPKINFIIH